MVHKSFFLISLTSTKSSFSPLEHLVLFLMYHPGGHLCIYKCTHVYVYVGGGGSLLLMILKFIQEHSFHMGRAIPEVRISVKGEPRMGV